MQNCSTEFEEGLNFRQKSSLTIESFIQELSFVPLCLLLYYSFWGEIEGEVLFCKSATSKERKASYSVTLLEFQAEYLI